MQEIWLFQLQVENYKHRFLWICYDNVLSFMNMDDNSIFAEAVTLAQNIKR